MFTEYGRKLVDVKRFLNSALIMFIICESMINTILVMILPISDLLGYVMLLLGILVIAVQQIKMDLKVIGIVLFCVGVFIVSWFRGYFADSILYFIQFLSFGAVGIVGAKIKFNPTVIFKASIVITEIFIVLNIANTNLIESDFDFGYAIIPGFMSCVFMIYNSYKSKNRSRFILYIVFGIPIAIMILFRSSRGNVVQILTFFLLGMIGVFGQKILAVVFFFIGILITFNFRNIVSFLNDLMNRQGLKISFISKTYWLLNTPGQSLMHNRDILFGQVKENTNIITWMFGNGIGSFEHVAGTYTHNIFLSFFCDMGIIGVLFVAVLFMRFFKIYTASNSKITIEDREFLLMIFTLSFVKLCFSSIYWKSSAFWYLVSYLF